VKREEIIAKVEDIANRAAAAAGVELVECELKGSGRHQMLRLTIDKPEGVTHGDCETVSRQASDLLDAEDPIPGQYQLEVSSPGVERPLTKWPDWQRFQGQKAKVVLKEPLAAESGAAPLKHFEGVIAGAEASPEGALSVTVELAGNRKVTFPFEQVSRANLKFDW
jgi:ribosome maturation factor RimP